MPVFIFERKIYLKIFLIVQLIIPSNVRFMGLLSLNEPLHKLTDLTIRRNISTLPDIFSQLPALSRLQLEGSNITELPESFYALADLTYLNITGVPVSSQTIARVIQTFPNAEIWY